MAHRMLQVANTRVKAAHAHVAASQVAIAEQLCLLFRSKLFKSSAEARACCQLTRRKLRPICFSRPRWAVENDLPLALKDRLNTRGYPLQARERSRRWTTRRQWNLIDALFYLEQVSRPCHSVDSG